MRVYKFPAKQKIKEGKRKKNDYSKSELEGIATYLVGKNPTNVSLKRGKKKGEQKQKERKIQVDNNERFRL